MRIINSSINLQYQRTISRKFRYSVTLCHTPRIEIVAITIDSQFAIEQIERNRIELNRDTKKSLSLNWII